MKTYVVNVKVEGSVKLWIDAEDFDDAYDQAVECVGEMDFGPLRNIEWEPVNASSGKEFREY